MKILTQLQAVYGGHSLHLMFAQQWSKYVCWPPTAFQQQFYLYFFRRIKGREAYTCCRHHGKNFRCCCKKWRIDLYIALSLTVFKCNEKIINQQKWYIQ